MPTHPLRFAPLLALALTAAAPTSAKSTPPPAMDHLRLFPAGQGWGWGESALWHLDNAAAKKVRTAAPDGFIADTALLDAASARAAILSTNDSPTLHFLATDDAGATWRDTPLTVNAIGAATRASLSFLDNDRGWMLITADHGMNSSAGVLFATTDAGSHWREISRGGSGGYLPSTAPHALPFDGRISFLDPKTGYLVGSDTSTGHRSLALTRDGGATWNRVTLPTPPALARSFLAEMSLPQFSGHHGTLKAALENEDAHWQIHYTTDDGRNWTIGTLDRVPD